MDDYYTAWVCECCLVAAVSAEPCQCFADTEIEDLAADMNECHPYGLMGLIEEQNIWPQDNEYGETSKAFRWWSCDGCGGAAGEHYELHVYVN
jgi:hypothetical protein